MNARALESKIELVIGDLLDQQYATAHRRLNEIVKDAKVLQSMIRNRMAQDVEEYAQKAADLRRELESLDVPEPEPKGSTYPDTVAAQPVERELLREDIFENPPDDPAKAQAGGTWEPGDVPTGIGQMKAPEEPAEIRVLPESPAKQTSDRYTQLIEKQRQLRDERLAHFQGAPDAGAAMAEHKQKLAELKPDVQQQSVRPMDAPDESGDKWVYTEEKVPERVEYEEGEID